MGGCVEVLLLRVPSERIRQGLLLVGVHRALPPLHLLPGCLRVHVGPVPHLKHHRHHLRAVNRHAHAVHAVRHELPSSSSTQRPSTSSHRSASCSPSASPPSYFSPPSRGATRSRASGSRRCLRCLPRAPQCSADE